LKKRSKKLLFTVGFGDGVARCFKESKFFASFCSQKEALASFNPRKDSNG
jgi:hypothetical protein